MTMKKVNSVILSLLLIFGLQSCDSFSSLFEEEEEGPKESIEEYIQDAQVAEDEYKVAIYCIEDGNDPLGIYDYFDYEIYMGKIDKMEIDYSDGVYHAFSNEIHEDGLIVKRYDLLMYFSSDRLYIDSLFITNVYEEPNFVDNISREVTFTCEVYSPIPVVTPDVDSIWENGKLEYLLESTKEMDFTAKLVEKYIEEDNSSYSLLNYPNTVGENTYLKAYVFFRVW